MRNYRKNYGIEPNKEYQITDVKKIIKCIVVELTDTDGKAYIVDMKYLENNFEIICKMD